jgi:Ca2+-binding RTX toxin-like protein
MRRPILLFVLVVAVTLLAAGIALAARVDVRCNGGECRGTDMNERLFGTSLEDVIYASGGNDLAYGRGSNDLIKGDQGDDEVYGQAGNDKVKGGLGRDKVYGDSGDDFVRGGTHADPNDGVPDVLDCGDGTDTVYFTPGVDVVRANCEIRNSSTP